MGAYLLRRLAQAVLILLGVSLVTFVLLYLLPADPARQIAGRSATPEVVASIRAQLGLDRPFHEQYLRYLGALLQGDLGRSYLQRTEVATLIMSRLPASLLLMAGAIVCELALGLTMGVAAALRRNTAADHALMLTSFVGVSAPQFVVGMLLLYVFAWQLAWFPLGGYGTFAHLVLPSLTLGLLGAGWYSRMMRSAMLDVLRQDYMRTARAKGLSSGKVVLKHGLRAAITPILTIFGMDVGSLIGGSAVITESVFGINGIGKLAVDSVQNSDLPVILGTTLFAATFVVLANVVVDVVYGLVDPRVRLA
jgi:peptide/nickel transport system permease protein